MLCVSSRLSIAYPFEHKNRCSLNDDCAKRSLTAEEQRLRKLQRADELEQVLTELQDQNVPLIFTDGSSAMEEGIGRLADYGIYLAGEVAISAHMPTTLRQTNNHAELMAALRMLEIFTTGNIAIGTDSQYVILGATGAARLWKLRGWKRSCDPVSNLSLWEQPLLELDRPGRTVHWIKVPSHVHIDGNNEADRLAEQGRMSHPKFPELSTPAMNSLQYHTPKAHKRRKLLSAELSPSVATALEFPPPPPPPAFPFSGSPHSADSTTAGTSL